MERIRKEIGETPLEALERLRASRPELTSVPMTYAGRLDPMAEGELIILIGDECKDKEKYLGLDKEYEIEIILGIKTDTFDALGLAELGKHSSTDIDLNAYIGKFKQEYPPYSSKTVNGKQLHELARANELSEEIPTKEVEIYSIENLGERTIASNDLKNEILRKISLVKGDFRQEEIKKRWNEVLGNDSDSFKCLEIRVKCSSGTYMRSLAEKMGGFALSINRTRIILTSKH